MILAPIHQPATEPSSAEREAGRLYQRVLAAWAHTALELRRRGMDRPGHATPDAIPRTAIEHDTHSPADAITAARFDRTPG